MPTVLYAEDDPEHQLMMRVVLKDTNITLVEAMDGQDALKKIRDYRPDLILLDLFMPRLDGYGVLKAIKSNPVTREIPVVVLSAWPTGDNRERAKKAGAIDFIAKPYKPIELAKQIKGYLSIQTDSESVASKPDTAPHSV